MNKKPSSCETIAMHVLMIIFRKYLLSHRTPNIRRMLTKRPREAPMNTPDISALQEKLLKASFNLTFTKQPFDSV